MRKQLFSFPAQPAGPPSRRNWYQELLDHPQCQGRAEIVREAYLSNRETHLEAGIAELLTRVKPNQALLAHLKRLAADTETGGEAILADQDVNCAVIWARPSRAVVKLIAELQSELGELAGNDLHPTPARDLHLSVLEVSHQHAVPHLRRVVAKVSTECLQDMLDFASGLAPAPPLECPQLNFDGGAVALTFVPSADEPYTYHHLRSELQTRLLESGIGVDTCYTAATAHITIGRFVGAESLGATGDGAAGFVAGVCEINRRLRERYWGPGSAWRWRVGEETPLELQMGYLKFGRERKRALLVGQHKPVEVV